MKKLILIIFLFVAGGKFHQVPEYSTHLGYSSLGLQVKKTDKSPVFAHVKTCRFSKPKTRKPKGIKINSVAINTIEFYLNATSQQAQFFSYVNPLLFKRTNWILGRAPPLV